MAADWNSPSLANGPAGRALRARASRLEAEITLERLTPRA